MYEAFFNYNQSQHHWLFSKGDNSTFFIIQTNKISKIKYVNNSCVIIQIKQKHTF